MSTTVEPVAGLPVEATQKPSRFRLSLRDNASGIIGGALVAVFVIAGIAGALLLFVPSLQHLWRDQDLAATLLAPGGGHPLGTDSLGRDLLWRTIAGVGVSAGIGLAVTIMTLVIGLVMGLLAGYYGGTVDRVIGGVIDVVWGFPLILLAVMLAGIMKPGFLSILLAVGLLNWAGFARIIRGYALSLRQREFVEAALALGIPSHRILLRHFLPNVTPPTIVMASYYIAITIIVEAGVSFLGLGIQPPTPSLGQMIAEGRNYLGASQWPALVPGTAIALSVLGFSLLGDWLRDAFDPRLGPPRP